MVQATLALALATTLAVGQDTVAAALASPVPARHLSWLSPFEFIRGHVALGLAVMIALLLAAAAGLCLRVLVPLQFWITGWFPISCVTMADGGDVIAGLLVFEMLPYFLHPGVTTAQLARRVVRLQMSVVYLSAGVTKLAVPEWRQGTAIHSYVSDPGDGLVSDAAVRLVDSPLLQHAFTWSTPVIEIGLAAALIGSQRYRRGALVAGLVLHALLGWGFGLYTFHVVMICGLVILTEPWRKATRLSSLTPPTVPLSPDAPSDWVIGSGAASGGG